MKKFLSLVLALVMTMSLVTISAGADFTDAADVDYAEAVEVLTATKIVSGYTDGSVRPDVALNRGQAAKIICNLILGPTAAAALPTSVAPYADVPAGSTFAGYIAYLAKEGVVSGYANGTFQPTAPLTGYAFMKMLLGVLGYDAAIEGYTGTNWAVAVAKQALAIGLEDGLVDEFVGTKTVTRQEAMLFAFNALNAEWVEYDSKGTGISINGVTITAGASEVEVNEAEETYYQKLFDDELVATPGTDALGRPATTWTYDDEKVGTYAEKADYVATSNEKLYNVCKALKQKSTEDLYFYYTANTDTANFGGETTAQDVTGPDGRIMLDYFNAKSTAKLENLAGLGTYAGNGVTFEFFYDKDDAEATKIVVYGEWIGKIDDVEKDGDGKRFVEIGLLDYYTEDFAEGDYVLFTQAYDYDVDNAWEIVSMKAAEKLTGKITKEVGGTYTIGGVDYKVNANADKTAAVVGTDVDFWLDSNGYIIKVTGASSTASLDKLAVVVDKRVNGWNTEGKVVYGSGKVDTVVLKSATTSDNVVYTFSMDSNKLKVSEAVGYTTYYGNDTTNGYYFTKGATKITYNGAVDAASVNNATSFIVVDKLDNVTVYTGNNAPSFEKAEAIYVYTKTAAGTKAATAVFVFLGTAGKVSTSASDLVYIVMKDYKVATYLKDNGDTISYYEATDVAGKTYKFAEPLDSGNGLSASGDYYTAAGVKVYKAFTKNADDVITSATLSDKVSYYKDANAFDVEVAEGVVYLPTATLTYAADAALYVIDKDGNVDTGVISDMKESVKGYTYTVNTAGDQIVALVLKQG